jgi:nucleoside-diphosphate-sugar epimerase
MTDGVFVTGATGFVGAHLVQALRAQGRHVVTHSRADGDIARCPLRFDGVERVVHLAGRSFVPDSWQQPRDFYDVNLLGTANVLDACRRSNLPVVFVSSYVYGNPRSLPIAEDHPLQPLNPYSHSKILAEDAVRYYRSQFGVRATIVRPFNIYGPGQDERFLLPTIIRQGVDPAIDRITVRDLRPRRDFIHVRDLVALLIATLARVDDGVFNAGSGASFAVGEVVAEVNAALDRPKPVECTGDERREEVLDVVADISRAGRELGWTPRVAFRDGVRETVEWARTRAAALR